VRRIKSLILLTHINDDLSRKCKEHIRPAYTRPREGKAMTNQTHTVSADVQMLIWVLVAIAVGWLLVLLYF
jgi:hypothetical protein